MKLCLKRADDVHTVLIRLKNHGQGYLLEVESTQKDKPQQFKIALNASTTGQMDLKEAIAVASVTLSGKYPYGVSVKKDWMRGESILKWIESGKLRHPLWSRREGKSVFISTDEASNKEPFKNINIVPQAAYETAQIFVKKHLKYYSVFVEDGKKSHYLFFDAAMTNDAHDGAGINGAISPQEEEFLGKILAQLNQQEVREGFITVYKGYAQLGITDADRRAYEKLFAADSRMRLAGIASSVSQDDLVVAEAYEKFFKEWLMARMGIKINVLPDSSIKMRVIKDFKNPEGVIISDENRQAVMGGFVKLIDRNKEIKWGRGWNLSIWKYKLGYTLCLNENAIARAEVKIGTSVPQSQGIFDMLIDAGLTDRVAEMMADAKPNEIAEYLSKAVVMAQEIKSGHKIDQMVLPALSNPAMIGEFQADIDIDTYRRHPNGLAVIDLKNISAESKRAFEKMAKLDLSADDKTKYMLIFDSRAQKPVLIGRLVEEDRTLNDALFLMKVTPDEKNLPAAEQGITPTILRLSVIPLGLNDEHRFKDVMGRFTPSIANLFNNRTIKLEVIQVNTRFESNNGKLILRPNNAMIHHKQSAENGGIDLNQINVQRRGKKVVMQFDLAQLHDLMQDGFEGFEPVITDFQYISSPFQLLGVKSAL